jgi:hypothetical protein
MSDAPETLFAWPTARSPQAAKLGKGAWAHGVWTLHDTSGSWTGVSGKVEYHRADMPPTADQIMDDPRVKALVEALLECQAELDAYSRQEYPLDHPVHERYRKRDFDANPARIALAQLKGAKP